MLKSTTLTLSAVLLGNTASQAGRILPYLAENEQSTEKTYSQTKKVVNIESDTEITRNSSNASFPSLKSDDLLLTHDNLGLERRYSGVRSQKTEKSPLMGYKFPDISMPYVGLGVGRYVHPIYNRVVDESSSSDDEKNRTHENPSRESLIEYNDLAAYYPIPTYAFHSSIGYDGTIELHPRQIIEPVEKPISLGLEYLPYLHQNKKPAPSFGIELRLQF